jgi:cytochrome c oxidase assembly protein subunit 15
MAIRTAPLQAPKAQAQGKSDRGVLSAAFAGSYRTPTHKPGLALFAAASAAWVFILVTLGAFTTSINAGMAFPDWPLSNGSLNPHGWLSNLAMFAEHSHRLSAGLMMILTLTLAGWIWVRESRRWLRQAGAFALGLVLAQAVVGGLRVLLDPIRLGSLETSVGEIFAMAHACLAQAFACTLIAIALACSRRWLTKSVPVGPAIRRLGVICCLLLFVQLGIAAVMRHSFAGLAIPTFPWSGAGHRLLPAVWSFKVAIHFAHRAMAALLAVALVAFAVSIWCGRGTDTAMHTVASALVGLLGLQIVLGAAIISTYRDPLVTTAHVLVGALTLSAAFSLAWIAHRDAIEGGLS